jgi:prophage DNA circulation protein
MALIVNLNESIRVMGSRFEQFQSSIEDKMNRMQNENTLLKNKVDFITRNFENMQATLQTSNPMQTPQSMPSTVEGSPSKTINVQGSTQFEN